MKSFRIFSSAILSSVVLPSAVLLSFAACGSGDSQGDGDGGGGDQPDANQFDAGIDTDAGPEGDGGPPECTYTTPGQFNPGVECSWDDPENDDPYPGFDDVVATPVVVNMTDDNDDNNVDLNDIPDIAFVAYPLQRNDACPTIPGTSEVVCSARGTGVLRVVTGSCSSDDPALQQHFVVGPLEIAEMTADVEGGPYENIWLDNSSSPALGDIDGDGSVDIVAVIRDGGVIALERDGSFKWINLSHPTGSDYLDAPQPSIANVVKAENGTNDTPEIIVGRVVLRGDTGERIWGGSAGIGTNGFLGPVSAISDIDLDGTLNILAGDTIYTAQGEDLPDTGVNQQWAYADAITEDNCQNKGFACDGYTAIGNLDSDDEGEVVVVRAGKMYVFNHDGTALQVNGSDVVIDIPEDGTCNKPNEGGPPTIADFDGDGDAEFATAGSEYYFVADLECLAEPLPDFCARPGIRWEIENNDCSSRVTGSSVFDFDGDGAAEVIYNDETTFRILDGRTGEVRISRGNTSHTRLEMPIVVDVDNDGNAEIIFAENASSRDADIDAPSGIRVWGDATDTWVATRRIWNQHSYHVTNVGELGEIPTDEPVNWLTPTPNSISGVYNNFRQNLPEFDVFAAPDLEVELEVSANACGLTARVCNTGDANVGAGAIVDFYDNETMQKFTCDNGATVTDSNLAPGECTTVSCVLAGRNMQMIDGRACVDNEGYACGGAKATGSNNECNEDNNRDDASGMLDCSVID